MMPSHPHSPYEVVGRQFPALESMRILRNTLLSFGLESASTLSSTSLVILFREISTPRKMAILARSTQW